MQVKVMLIENDGSETLFSQCDLSDCFDADESSVAELEAARDEIERTGRVWLGGGASPRFLVMKSDSEADDGIENYAVAGFDAEGREVISREAFSIAEAHSFVMRIDADCRRSGVVRVLVQSRAGIAILDRVAGDA